jgi:hypothetical protein
VAISPYRVVRALFQTSTQMPAISTTRRLR